MKSTDLPIRVGVLTKPLDNWTSGSGHHLDELMHHVLDQNDGTFEFTFIHYKKSDNPIYSRVREIIIPRNPFAASRLLRKENFDILHYSPLSIYAPIWLIHAKKTATVHGIEEVLYPQGYTLIQRIHDTKIQPIYMRLMDRIATVSETGKRYFVEHYHIPETKVFITTNGLGECYRLLEEKEKSLPEELAISKPFVLHISRFSLRKNPVMIINGFAQFIQSSGLDYQLVCAGKGWDCAEVRTLAQNAGIADRLITPGFIADETAVKLLNNAAVFVFPSFAEGFGMPNIEAMACGCPVITSNIFAIPEIVGDAAVVLSQVDDTHELGNAIIKVVTNFEYKKALVTRGLEWVKRYNWNESADSILSHWKELYSSGK